MSATKKSPWRKRILIGGLILIAILGVIYWIVANDKFSATKDRKSHFTVTAPSFIAEFNQDATLANKKYKDKIITVTGIVSEMEPSDTTMNIKFIDSISGSYIIFAFQEQYLAEAKSLHVGDSVGIKGSFSDGFYSDILEATSINFKRSTIDQLFTK